MYDTDKARELQKQSHVRGALSKQFYYNQQSELEQKRRQMKRILDEQVEERKRAKEREKQMLENRQRKEQEEIKKYYENAGQRQRRVSENSLGQNNQNGNKMNQSPYEGQNESLVKKHVQQTMKQRVNSKTQIHVYDSGNYSLMPLLSLSEGQINQNRASNIQHEFSISSDRLNQLTYRNFDENAGNIPLLDLSDENTFTKTKKKTKVQIRKQPTERSERENNHVNNSVMRNSIAKLENSKSNQNKNGQNNNNNNQSPQNSNANILIMQSNQSIAQSIKKRHRTLSNEENPSLVQQQQINILNSRLSKGSKVNDNIINNNNKSPVQTKGNFDMEIPQEIQQMQTQNRQLKSELKKNQEAISLLIGAVRSNPKLDKFRVQAEKILHNQHTQTYPKTTYQPEKKFVEKKEESTLLLPKIKIKHQSIMHDYLLQAAKRARVKQIKSQTYNY